MADEAPTPTIESALLRAIADLQASSDSPRLDAEWLLCAVLDVQTAYLRAYPERALTTAQADQFTAWVERRRAGEPVAYILGEVGFYGRTFVVSPAVLIPRPETEHLVERALTALQATPGTITADIGTGSGAIAVTVAIERPNTPVYATDISPDALTIARQNAEQHGATITFMQGDLAGPLITAGVRVGLLLANLPYIADDDLAGLAVSRYEPRRALAGGPDGLDLIRRLLEQVPQVCTPDAIILLEIGADQGDALRQLAPEMLPGARVHIRQDYAGCDRIAEIHLSPPGTGE